MEHTHRDTSLTPEVQHGHCGVSPEDPQKGALLTLDNDLLMVAFPALWHPRAMQTGRGVPSQNPSQRPSLPPVESQCLSL